MACGRKLKIEKLKMEIGSAFGVHFVFQRFEALLEAALGFGGAARAFDGGLEGLPAHGDAVASVEVPGIVDGGEHVIEIVAGLHGDVDVRVMRLTEKRDGFAVIVVADGARFTEAAIAEEFDDAGFVAAADEFAVLRIGHAFFIGDELGECGHGFSV